MNPRLVVGNVKFEAYVDSDEVSSEPLTNCWVYLFWYTLRGEGGWSDEVYVDEKGLYHPVDVRGLRGKDERPHASRGTDGLFLPLTDVRKGERVDIFHVPLVSPFQIPWARLPSIPIGQTCGAKSREFRVLFDWLTDRRDILGSACIPAAVSADNGVRIARFRSAGHRALALSWDLGVVQRRLAFFVHDQPQLSATLVLRHVVEGILKSGRGDAFIDREAFESDRVRLRRVEELQAHVEHRCQLLVLHLDGRAFAEMVSDMNAAGGEAFDRFRETFAPVFDVLPSAPQADEYLAAFFAHNKGVLADQKFKATRRAAKAMWAFFKAAIKIATDPGLEELRNRIVSWAERIGVALKTDQHGLLFSRQVRAFETKVVENDVAHLVFMVMDAYNLALSLKDLRKEWQSTGLRSPKAFSAVAAASSLLGTSLGWRESSLKKLGRSAKDVKLWRGTKNAVGMVGNVADVVGTSWQAHKEFDVGDTDAGVALAASALGAASQAIGYGLLFVELSIGSIFIMIGAVVGVVALILYVFLDNDDIEDWLTHCFWGRARHANTSATTKWSEGPLSAFHIDAEKQLRALNQIFFGFDLSWDYQPVDPVLSRERTSLRLRADFARLPSGAKVVLKVVAREQADERVLRPQAVWSSASVERDAHGEVTAAWEEFDALGFDEVVAEARIDVYGDGSQLFPPAHLEPSTARFRVPLIERVLWRPATTSG